MDIPSTVESKEAFGNYLLKINLHPDVYRVLEFVFRQAMMEVGDENFVYHGEKKCDAIFQPTDHENYCFAILGQIDRWERRHFATHGRKLHYGFAALHIDEFEADQKMLEKLEDWILRGKDIFGRDAENKILALNKEFRDLGLLHDVPQSKYATIDPQSGSIKIEEPCWIYFRTYFVVAKIIFSPVIEAPHITAFISTKVIREHFKLPWIAEEFKPKNIGNRMRGTRGLELSLKQRLTSSGLVGGELEKFAKSLVPRAHLLGK